MLGVQTFKYFRETVVVWRVIRLLQSIENEWDRLQWDRERNREDGFIDVTSVWYKDELQGSSDRQNEQDSERWICVRWQGNKSY